MTDKVIQLDFKELIDALIAIDENKRAARKYARAQRIIKALLPWVEEPTVFQVGEDYRINVIPVPRDGFEVKATTIQLKQISRRGDIKEAK